MTMLDRMRRHRDWLKWSLGLVCVAFVLFYIPDFLRGSGADAASGDTVAKVEGREITSADFRRTYQAQLQAYRSAYGGNMSDQLLKQLGIEQQILQQMVDERAALAEAERLGIKVQRRGSAAADLRDAGVPGERRVHRRGALPAAAAHAAAADGRLRVRGQRPPRSRRREAARLADRLAVGERQGSREGIPPPQRQGEARGRQLHRRQLPHPGQRQRRGSRELLRRRTRTTSRSPRSARSAIC